LLREIEQVISVAEPLLGSNEVHAVGSGRNAGLIDPDATPGLRIDLALFQTDRSISPECPWQKALGGRNI
jgi:hypothetical protein